MSWRTVIIDSQSKLDYKMGYLVFRGIETKRILLDEIAVLVIENPAVSITGYLLAALTEKKIKVIFCDIKRNPTAELIPHHGCHDSSAKIRTQISWNEDIKSVVWQEIISEKIRKQADFLFELGKDKQAEMLQAYIGQVEENDATNREGHAAKVYFNTLFGVEFEEEYSSLGEKLMNYFELVRAYDREKTFILFNLRGFMDEKEINLFFDEVLKRGHQILLIDSMSYPLAEKERRVLVDKDLCEIV